MRRKAILITIIFMFICSSGCESINTTNIAKKQCDSVLEYLQNNDDEGLKGLFCEEVRNSSNIDSEIENVLELFDGKIISHDNYQISDGDEWEDGKLVQSHASPIIYNVLTDKKNIYTVSFFTFTNNIVTERIGITVLEVKLINGEEQTIGYFISY